VFTWHHYFGFSPGISTLGVHLASLLWVFTWHYYFRCLPDIATPEEMFRFGNNSGSQAETTNAVNKYFSHSDFFLFEYPNEFE
jgi:hypothetical protein